MATGSPYPCSRQLSCPVSAPPYFRFDFPPGHPTKVFMSSHHDIRPGPRPLSSSASAFAARWAASIPETPQPYLLPDPPAVFIARLRACIAGPYCTTSSASSSGTSAPGAAAGQSHTASPFPSVSAPACIHGVASEPDCGDSAHHDGHHHQPVELRDRITPYPPGRAASAQPAPSATATAEQSGSFCSSFSPSASSGASSRPRAYRGKPPARARVRETTFFEDAVAEYRAAEA